MSAHLPTSETSDPASPPPSDPRRPSDERRAAAIRDRVLDAIAAREPERPEVARDFAAVALRRLPPRLSHRLDPEATAERLLLALQAMDRRRAGEVRIEVHQPATGLDGRAQSASVVQVACEDRPFLLASVSDELELRGHGVARALHPIVGVERGADGRITAIVPAREAAHRESLLHLELDDRLDDVEEEAVRTALARIVADVLVATDDFHPMRDRVTALAEQLRTEPWPGTTPAERTEAAALLDWLADGNLVLLGVRDYTMHYPDDGPPTIAVAEDSGLGVLSDPSTSRFSPPVSLDELPTHLRQRLEDPPLVTVTRSTRLSTVKRRIRMDVVGVIRRDAAGRPASEFRVVGLFTRKGLAEPSRSTPLLRDKLGQVLAREDVVPGSHDEATLIALFQALPKDELFQASVDELQATLIALLHAEEHREIRTLVRIDHHTRSISVLVSVPRDRYSASLRRAVHRALVRRFAPRNLDIDLSLSDRNEALVRFLVQLDQPVPEVPVAAIQQEIHQLARSWADELTDALDRRVGDGEARRLMAGVGHRLPRAYLDAVTPEAAIPDVLLLDGLEASDTDLLVALDPGPLPATIRLKAAKRGAALELSGFLPILESLGLTVVEEVPYPLADDRAELKPLAKVEGAVTNDDDGAPALPVDDGQRLVLHDFGVRIADLDPDRDGPRVADAVLAAWRGHLETDSLNRLVLVAGLDHRDVSILRAYRRYRRQLGAAYTPAYVNDVLVANPEVVRALVAYLHARFDPAVTGTAVGDAERRAALAACDALDRLDHDRILRMFVHLVDATLRTNAFRPDALADTTGERYLAFKLDPARIPGVPKPVPYREVFVHSPRVEGVHLRGGPVARGGLRWSDRRDDVRTEVLDLVKAQILKNALIVPTGAKGGFVLTREPDDPAERAAEVKRQYVTFIRGLLDVTDDLDGDTVVAPPDVVRHDGDDPYLVVAADRGTATFSDTANALARRYGFWLDDAFASGGSNGYDHKALGVTARGAWIAVQRHFRELGIDVQREPITIAGIGDMSGDVFGNGMLCSEAVKLVAAFDHRHVFLDPDPDPARSFAERARLFLLPRSSWDDYDRAAISAGGGVFPRTVRSIPISDEVRALLRIEDEELPPPELIRALLAAPVDLLFAGGIGTYVRATDERNEDVGDRANDELRIPASRLRARVLGEGANLAITQRARIEYARHGGRCNQDAIDNAAGVSTSDHEVNLKILLTLATESGALDPDARDALLAELADDVVAQVMREVDLQTAALSQEAARSHTAIDAYEALMCRLESDADLDRAAEVLPDAAELAARARAGGGLTRPELATLLAWAKRDLKESLLGSDVLDEPVLRAALRAYFPPRLSERFGALLERHRLRRELIATVVANDLVDRLGITFASAAAAQSGMGLAQVALAYRVAREVIDAPRWWDLLDLAIGEHDPARLLELEHQVDQLVADLTITLLTDPGLADPTALLARDRPVAEVLVERLLTLGTAEQQRGRMAHARWLIDDLIDPDLARLLACARDLALIPDVAIIASSAPGDRPPDAVAGAALLMGARLGLDQLESALTRVEVTEAWQRRQHAGLASDLRGLRRAATLSALRARPSTTAGEAVEGWVADRAGAVERARRIAGQAAADHAHGLDAVAVAARAVRDVLAEPG